jgi:ribosomal protein S1
MSLLIPNLELTKRARKEEGNNSITIYCQEEYAEELYLKYKGHKSSAVTTPKDMSKGQMCRAEVISVVDGHILLQTESAGSVYMDLLRESKFLDKQGISREILTPGHAIDVMIDSTSKKGDHYTGSMETAFRAKLRADLYKSMKEQNAAYKVTVKSINQGGFIVDLSGMECFMPGSLAAANKILDFESMLGKEIYVMVENYLESSDMFVVSNKKYIQWILPHKAKELGFDTQYSGTITGVMKYGAFVEWDEIFTGLLHESEASDDLKNFKAGDAVTFWVKEVRENKETNEIRIILSQKGPSAESVIYQQFKDEHEGKIFPEARVKDVKPFGISVEMGNVTGMFTPREFKRTGAKARVDEVLDVTISKVDVASRRVYLKSALSEEDVNRLKDFYSSR